MKRFITGLVVGSVVVVLAWTWDVAVRTVGGIGEGIGDALDDL